MITSALAVSVNSTRPKYKQKMDSMILVPLHANVPFQTVHVDFAELKKISEGVKKTQSFLVCIDEHSRIVAAKPRRQNVQTVIALLNRDVFQGLKCVVSGNGSLFKS